MRRETQSHDTWQNKLFYKTHKLTLASYPVCDYYNHMPSNNAKAKNTMGWVMIEELKIVQEIFGDLSAVGAWAIAAYFIYKLVIVAAWLSSGLAVVNLVKWFYTTFKKHEAELERIEIDKDREVVNARSERDEWKRKAEDTMHMYKILKGDQK